MLNNRLFLIGAIAATFLALGVLLGRANTPVEAAAAPETATTSLWTCPMHPEVQQAEPGSCPLCGMDLVAADHASGAAQMEACGGGCCAAPSQREEPTPETAHRHE